MIKKTIFLTRPAYLSVSKDQLRIEFIPKEENSILLRPLEDIAMIILEHPQITLSHALIQRLIEYQGIIVSCNEQHLPNAMFLPVSGHSLMSAIVRYQIQASIPLKKNLWQQVVKSKIENQERLLKKYGFPANRLRILCERVQSGDPENVEAQAAAYYWKTLFGNTWERDRSGDHPNSWLNFGYAILRGLTARSLVSAGLLLIAGIHHRNQYNHYCLADDMMEPYRPMIDGIVYEMFKRYDEDFFFSKELKSEILTIATLDVGMGNKTSPLMVALADTASSLANCFQGKKKRIALPLLIS